MLANALGRGVAFALFLAPIAACEAQPTELAARETAPLKLTGRVVDAANIFDPAQEALLTRHLEAIERDTRVQCVVVSTPDLEGYDISDYSLRLGNGWGLGDKDRDDGLLLVIAPNERKVRISTGLGLEKIVPDEFCAKVIEEMLPRFKEGDVAAGACIGVERLGAELRSKIGNQA